MKPDTRTKLQESLDRVQDLITNDASPFELIGALDVLATMSIRSKCEVHDSVVNAKAA